ncbi:DUF1566 domain-containing protein [Legionella tunisiensis]|uniref:DUF1566 domain-containing protein n=1 Tax=Legionella tunisiensis TaxID=1034944 RepID=UPI0003027D4D|nr:DUF1566 domain-containing protein [Legionella tunisiensis]
MKRYELTKRFLISAIVFFISNPTQAGSALWTFMPLTAISMPISRGSSAIIQYIVTNKSHKTHTLAMTTVPGISQMTTAGNCSNPFTLDYQQSCILTLEINGNALQGSVVGGPKVCEQENSLLCYQPNQFDIMNVALITPPGATTLASSVTTLGLSVQDTGLNAALTGTPRRITITNTGAVPAIAVAYSLSATLPAGTTISPLSCGTIVPSGTCVLTITPGSMPSATPGNTNPTPITLSISSVNTNTLTLAVNILTYGSVYQGGYIYAIDDTTPNTDSIGGKVIQTSDNVGAPGGIVWDSSTNGCVNLPNNNCYITNADSELNGTNLATPAPGGNTYLIYQTLTTINGESATSYAAGLCTATISGYNDWYLPAICEMGYLTAISNPTTNCGSSTSPALQNIQSNLVENGNIGNFPNGGNPVFPGIYWTSTELSSLPNEGAWIQQFAAIGSNSYQSAVVKGINSLGVRCSRILIP